MGDADPSCDEPYENFDAAGEMTAAVDLDIPAQEDTAFLGDADRLDDETEKDMAHDTSGAAPLRLAWRRHSRRCS